QTRAGAISNSDNRAAVMLEVLESFTGEQSLTTAQSLASQAALASALAGEDPATTVAARFAGSTTADLSDEILLVADRNGTPVYARAAPNVRGLSVPSTAVQDVLRQALAGSTCVINHEPGAC